MSSEQLSAEILNKNAIEFIERIRHDLTDMENKYNTLTTEIEEYASFKSLIDKEIVSYFCHRNC